MLGIGSRRFDPGGPEMELTKFVPIRATAFTVSPFVGPEIVVARLSRLLSMSGTRRNVARFVAGTGSIQTGCQMPLHEVYMMPPGERVCLPRGSPAASVGS